MTGAVYATPERARADITRYLELCCNRTRLQSTLGYRNPHETHESYLASQTA